MGKVKVSWRKELSLAKKKAKKDRNFAKKYYVFNHGNDFTPNSVKAFQKLGLKVIVSINSGHFTQKKQSSGEEAIQKNINFGVDGFQIDSCYDKLFITK